MPKLRSRAAVLHGVRDLRVEERELPAAPPPGAARVALRAVGICGSDVHYYERGRIAHFVVEKPMVIGHEAAGVVAAVGDGVTALRVGDRVALEGGVPCWASPVARAGRYNLDPSLTFFAPPPTDVALAEAVDHPAEWCHKLPDGVTFEEGALAEPLSVGVHACRRAGVAPGARVAVLGAGPIGLVCLLAARAFAADAVAITDVKEGNLELARRLGADAALRVAPGEPPAEVAERLRAAAAAPGGFEVVIDAAGFEATARAAIAAAAPGGKVVLVGMGAEEVAVPLAAASIKEVDLLGCFRYAAGDYPIAIQLMASRRADARPLVTHRVSEGGVGLVRVWRAAASARCQVCEVSVSSDRDV